jgi:spermidine/putrescine transport system permease protein
VLSLPVICLSVELLFRPVAPVTWSYLLVWTMTLYLGWTMFLLPYGAWGAELSTDYHERSRVSGARETASVLGTLVAVALVRQRFRGSKAVDTFLVLPLTSPEVVMGASLLTLFLSMGWATGFITVIIAHVAFEISFIAMTVRARIRGFDWTLEDASLDLGAGPTRTFFKVTLPLIVPGIVAAAMLSFALSLDDFIITYFVSGSTVTYPLYVNAATKAAVPPQINVLATAILLISLVLLAVGTLYRRKRIDLS